MIPNYYQVLSLDFDPNLSIQVIRTAYKRASLLTHPDRNPNFSESERRRATEDFQRVADAYYVLSDPRRRQEYDEILANQLNRSPGEPDGSQDPRIHQEPDHQHSPSDRLKFLKSFLFNLSNNNPSSSSSRQPPHSSDGRPDPEATFADVFEDLLRPEIERTRTDARGGNRWKYLGAASGGTLGFIIGNLPGMAIGTMAGHRLGAVRDTHGRSVYEVFSSLEVNQRHAILRALAVKVLGYALS